ncbi:hypothetical protein Q8F55_004688 [Vanrija albida]|uniref:Uncharacterized protein n=1 Tax=Vanrija albida TaxID=181172 RepID=A0ABR3Q7G5_9TREE
MPRSRSALLYAVAALSAASTVLAARSRDVCPEDPYLDPANDQCNPFRYVPSLGLNAAACALYFAVALAFTYNQFRYRGRYFLCLVIGTFTAGIGFILRLTFRKTLHSSGGYIAMYLFVVLSPCAFLAADYILLGRIVNHLDAGRYLFINPSKVSTIFIISDIVTFLIQAVGGGTSSARDQKARDIGVRIFLAGLAAQLLSFLLFSLLWVVFLYRARKDEFLWKRSGWKPLYFALGFTCICFLIRSFFRTIELSEGYAGHLSIHEKYYMGLDALPLFVGIAVYVWYWPYRILTPETKVQRSEWSNEQYSGDDTELAPPVREHGSPNTSATLADDDMNGEGKK